MDHRHFVQILAVAREKQLKAGSRGRKIALVNVMHPDWRDLYDDLTEMSPPQLPFMAIASSLRSSQ
jgi:hypothetical protein